MLNQTCMSGAVFSPEAFLGSYILRENLHNFSSLFKSADLCLNSSFSHVAFNATTLWSWLLSPSLFLLSAFSLEKREREREGVEEDEKW